MKYVIKDTNQHIFQNRFYDFKTEQLLSPVETQNYIIIQVAESHYNRGFEIEEHRQICDLELTFSCVNGLLCAADGVFERVPKNAVYLSFRGEKHALKSRKSANFQTLAVNFKEGESSALLKAITEKVQSQHVFLIPRLLTNMLEIVNEFRLSEAAFFEQSLDCLITSVLVKLARFGKEEAFEELLSYDETLTEIKNYLDNRFLQIGSLEELSSVFGYTYSYLSKAFKAEYGKTPRDYLAEQKTAYACTLLKNGVRLEEIAETLGYSSPFNFSRAFKNRIGMSPMEYKKNAR